MTEQLNVKKTFCLNTMLETHVPNLKVLNFFKAKLY